MRFIIFAFFVNGFALTLPEPQKIVTNTQEIKFEAFPGAFNPSILKVDSGILFTFRYMPDRVNNPFLSYIGIALLSDDFKLIDGPQLLNTRSIYSPIRSQTEDARLFSYRGRVFVIYNDNMWENNQWYGDKRDMHIAEVFYQNNEFRLSSPIKLVYGENFHSIVQKNWTPFEWNYKLLFNYKINPHEIIYPDLMSGNCYFHSKSEPELPWEWGVLRGSTPPQLIDGEYLSFFHSGKPFQIDGNEVWHYFMGAYTFSSSPPFEVKKYSPLPIVGRDFYTTPLKEKRVIFPGGFIIDGSNIYLAYGKDDCEMWIATIDRDELKKSLEKL